MHIGQALDLVSRYDSLRNPLTSLGDYLDPELISRCLAESGTVTLRKRRPSPRNDGLVYCWHGA
ncbi:IS4 ORF [Shigella sonnei]|nr:IS4 ORF [Shigella sonnei]